MAVADGEFVEAALSRGDRSAATAGSTTSLDGLVAAHGDAVLPLEMDVTDKAAVVASVRLAREHLGRVALTARGHPPGAMPACVRFFEMTS